jgi:hypothetical protein
MTLPERDANSDDPIVSPYRDLPSNATNNYKIAGWLSWRLTDPSLDPHMRALLEAEAEEALSLARLQETVEAMPGDSLEAKLADDANRATLRSLSLEWMRNQANLIEAATAAVDNQAQSNGHG